MVRLFDIHNDKVVPTEHCYTMKSLRAIMEQYPNDYLKIYAYIFYKTCPNPELNPFYDLPEEDQEEMIINEVDFYFSTEDKYIIKAIEVCEKLYQTPTYRAFMGIKVMLDNLADYMRKSKLEHGRDGNITAVVNAAAKYDQIRQSFKGAARDLQEEQEQTVRGAQRLAYDQ